MLREFRPLRAAAAACLLASALTSPSAWAGPFEPVSAAEAKTLSQAIQRHTGGKVKVGEIRTTPIPGVYQVDSEGELLYVDRSGRYGFSGAQLIDMQQQVDLTAQQIDRVHAIPFNSLPLQLAIKEVRGNGRRIFAVFEDPNCPICKVFTKFVDALDNVTVYKFMFPVIDPSSAALARVAWCAPQRGAVWHDIMAGARPSGRQDCDTAGLREILQLGERYAINNTPTVILANGRRLVGATPPEQFIAELDASASGH